MSASSSRDVECEINYVIPGFGGAVWPAVGSPDEAHHRERVKLFEAKRVTVIDARQVEGGIESWSFDTHGFTMLSGLPSGWDFLGKDKKRINKEYLPKLAELAKQATGAKYAYGLQGNTRDEKHGDLNLNGRNYAGFAHADYGPESPPSGRKVLVDKIGLSEAEAADLDVCFANIWHPIDHPAYKDPLCLLDASSIPVNMSLDDTLMQMPFDMNNLAFGVRDQFRKVNDAVAKKSYFTKNRSRSTLEHPEDSLVIAAKPAPTHRWVFCPDMAPNEAWLFKQWDSRDEPGRARCSFHTAFADPFHAQDLSKPGRRSLEARMCLAFTKTPAPLAARL